MFIIVLLFISDVKRIYQAESETVLVSLGSEFKLHGMVGFMNLIVVIFLFLRKYSSIHNESHRCDPFAVPIRCKRIYEAQFGSLSAVFDQT